MGFMANIKGNKAASLHSKKQYREALKLYEEAYNEGMNSPRTLVSYSSLLVRLGEYQKARELIVKIQKVPMLPEQKINLYCNYAAAVCRLGEPGKGVAVLEQPARKTPSGLLYQTLGYLYVAWLEERPDPNEPAPIPEKVIDPDTDDEDPEDEEDEEPIPTPYEQWQANVEKARKFLEEAIDYDDEDSICLDNIGQFYYRVMGDKEKALEYFQKAIALRATQIDTLWFLSRYDVEAGKTRDAIQKLQTAARGNYSALNYVTRDDVKQEIQRLGGKLEENED